jgi:hypothetical protein
MRLVYSAFQIHHALRDESFDIPILAYIGSVQDEPWAEQNLVGMARLAMEASSLLVTCDSRGYDEGIGSVPLVDYVLVTSVGT